MGKINTLFAEYKKKLKDVEAFMNPGASEQEINQLEKAVGFTLPESYRALLKKHNGGKGKVMVLPFGLLSTAEVLPQYQMLALAESPRPPHSIFQDGLVVPELWHPGRVPFSHDGSGNYLCIDFAPGKKGKTGQILYVPCGDPEPLSVIFWSFDDYIDFLIDGLQRDQINLYDDREDYDEEDRHGADIYFYREWRDDWTDIAAQLKID